MTPMPTEAYAAALASQPVATLDAPPAPAYINAATEMANSIAPSQHRRFTDSADLGDLQYLGIGRRVTHWFEQLAVRVMPGSVDPDDTPSWSSDDDDPTGGYRC